MTDPVAAATTRAPTDPLGATLQIIGDRWVLLILRDAFLSARRFQDWESSLGISAPVLSQRLSDLVEDGLLERILYSDSPARHEYRLTEPAKELWTVFVAIWSWNQDWLPPDARTEAARLVHNSCGHAISPLLTDRACGALGVTTRDTSALRRPGASFEDANPPRRYRRTQHAVESAGDKNAGMDAASLLGDRWSTSVLAAALLGAHRFAEFQEELGAIPPLQLTDRLQTFERHDVLRRVPVALGAKRMMYRLTPKGRAFFPIFATILAWGRQFRADPAGPALTIVHDPCGQPLDPGWTCNGCGEPLERRAIHFEL